MSTVAGNKENEGQGREPPAFQRVQIAFAAHLRAPQQNAAPSAIEDRRLGIYRDLIYNNIESFIAGGFPVLRSLYSDTDWHDMVRDFVHHHASQSPYFLQISEEFLDYLQSEHQPRACDPAFLLELAHYEWVELALDVSDAEFPRNVTPDGNVLEGVPVVSPLVWSLSYSFPVHQVGVAFQPRQPPKTPTFLVVYRDRSDKVGFMETNAVTARLLQLAQAETLTGRELLEALAEEMQHPEPATLIDFGRDLLERLRALDIIAGVRL